MTLLCIPSDVTFYMESLLEIFYYPQVQRCLTYSEMESARALFHSKLEGSIMTTSFDETEEESEVYSDADSEEDDNKPTRCRRLVTSIGKLYALGAVTFFTAYCANYVYRLQNGDVLIPSYLSDIATQLGF